MHDDASSNAGVLVTGKLAATLPAACCGIEATNRATWVMQPLALHTHERAGVIRLTWRCVLHSPTIHTQWVDADIVIHATKVADANKALQRGAHEQTFEAENSNRVALWHSRATGRFTVARQTIAVGECAVRATAFAVVVKQTRILTHCHWCLTALVRKCVQCGTCKSARYCTRACLDADAPLHDFQCRVLAALRDTTDHVRSQWLLAGMDVETVRLAVAVLSMEQFVNSTAALRDLVTRSAERSARRAIQRDVARFVVAAISDIDEHNSDILTQHIIDTLERVQTSAHPVATDGASVLGIGLFPDAAKALNHACRPNVVATYDALTRTLAFRAVRSIDEREAVEFAYIELVQSTTERRRLLHDAFGFECMCQRCVLDSQQQSLAESNSVVAAGEQLQQVATQTAASPTELATRLKAFKAAMCEPLARSIELRFTLRLLELQAAVTQHDAVAQQCAARELLSLWHDMQLPMFHPTVAVLWRHLQRASEHVGESAAADAARAEAERIRQVCGLQWSAPI